MGVGIKVAGASRFEYIAVEVPMYRHAWCCIPDLCRFEVPLYFDASDINLIGL